VGALSPEDGFDEEGTTARQGVPEERRKLLDRGAPCLHAHTLCHRNPVERRLVESEHVPCVAAEIVHAHIAHVALET
jgi:hypothetical protein